MGQIMTVVRGDQGDARLLRQADNMRIDALFDVQALILDFEEKVPLAEDVAQSVGSFSRLVRAFLHQAFGNGAAQARRQGDQAATVLRQQVVINSGFVIKPFEVTGGHELDEVAISFGIFAKQYEMIGAALPGLGR